MAFFWINKPSIPVLSVEAPALVIEPSIPVLSVEVPSPKEEIVYDEKEEEDLVREYCSSCITPEGEIKCPRRHRCKTCHCYLTDEEWFQQFKK
jgi:glutamate/tyrosine decarboxylase-like PLP-dependent enzyme